MVARQHPIENSMCRESCNCISSHEHNTFQPGSMLFWNLLSGSSGSGGSCHTDPQLGESSWQELEQVVKPHFIWRNKSKRASSINDVLVTLSEVAFVRLQVCHSGAHAQLIMLCRMAVLMPWFCASVQQTVYSALLHIKAFCTNMQSAHHVCGAGFLANLLLLKLR